MNISHNVSGTHRINQAEALPIETLVRTAAVSKRNRLGRASGNRGWSAIW